MGQSANMSDKDGQVEQIGSMLYAAFCSTVVVLYRLYRPI